MGIGSCANVVLMGCGRSKEEAPKFNPQEVQLDLGDGDDSSATAPAGEPTGPDFVSSGKMGGFGSSSPQPEDESTPEKSSWEESEPVETKFLKAVRAGNLIKVEEFLKFDVFKLSDSKVQSCLYQHLVYAHDDKNPGVVDTLIKHSADVDYVDDEGETALHVSAQDGELDVTRLLLNAGANVNVIKHHGGTPLHLAAEEGHAEIAKALADAGANVEMLDDDGRTPLHRACGSETPDVAVGAVLIRSMQTQQTRPSAGLPDALLQYVNKVDQEAKTALHHAVCEATPEHRQFVQYLLEECGATTNSTEKDSLQTPLHDAIERGDRMMISLLLRFNADRNVLNQQGESCELLATQKGLDLMQLKAMPGGGPIGFTTQGAPASNVARVL